MKKKLKEMKQIGLIALLLCGMVVSSTAQDTTLITDAMPNAIVHQDSMVQQLMQDKRIGRIRGIQNISGFRVQIYASNNQQVAKKEAADLQQRVEVSTDMPIYIVSEPPFWKVRVGDFLSREEANLYKVTFLEQFPDLVGSTYIVPDQINIVQ